MKNLLRPFLVVFVLVIIIAMIVPATVVAQDPIVIGASLPLTGDFSIPGELHQQGYQLCVDLINERGGLLGRPVELIVNDNRSEVEQVLSQYERLINEDQVDLIFGTFSSRLTFPASAVAQQNEMVFPIPAGGALSIYVQGFDYLFYFQQNVSEYTGQTPVEMLQTLVPDDLPASAAVVHADDFFANAIASGLVGESLLDDDGNVLADLAPGALADAGIELVYQETYPGEGFSDWLTLANSVKESGAEMVIALTASPAEAIEFTRALQTVDHLPKILYMSQGTQSEFLEGVGAEAAEGVAVHSAWHPRANFEGQLLGEPFSNQDFIDAFAAANDGAMPDEDAAIPFSLCQGMSQAVEGAGTTDNTALRDWLAARTEDDPVRTILGNFYWDDRGIPIGNAFVMTQWQNGELELVYPVGQFEGTADLVYPKPGW
jgi:branched-chain amino acid transport system substrate-binding protein